MAKKNETLLSLPDLVPDFGIKVDLIPQGDPHVLTANRQRINEELQKQKAIIEAISVKSIYGISKILELDIHANTNFCEAVELILETKRGVHLADCQPFIDEFSLRMIQVVAKQLQGVVKFGTTDIIRIIAQTPNPPLPPEPPKAPEPQPSIWKLLFG